MTKAELINQLHQIWSDLDDALRNLSVEASLDDVDDLDLIAKSCDRLTTLIDRLKKENEKWLKERDTDDKENHNDR